MLVLVRYFIQELELDSFGGLHVFTIFKLDWVGCDCIQDFTALWIGFVFAIVAGCSTVEDAFFYIVDYSD